MLLFRNIVILFVALAAGWIAVQFSHHARATRVRQQYYRHLDNPKPIPIREPRRDCLH